VTAGGVTVAGSDVTFDGIQKAKAALLGVSAGKRANSWTYDNRSRLATTVVAREEGAVPFTDQLTAADFRSKLDRPLLPQADEAHEREIDLAIRRPSHRIARRGPDLELARGREGRGIEPVIFCPLLRR